MTSALSWRKSVLVLAVLLVAAVPMYANHSWGNYHWARTANPFTLKVNDNVTSNWEAYVAEAQSDWNQSTVLDLNVIWQNPLSSTRKCASVAGQIEICNNKYGQNGWLGIAGISISGSHITKAYTKLNDTYFNMAQYNTPAWRRMVTCQELAHDFGLDHQDETFDNANLGSCMDYTNDPDGGAGGASSNDPSNEHPNSHDFQQISTIYSHTDSTTTISSMLTDLALSYTRPPTMVEINGNDDDFGTPVHYDGHGRPNVFAKPTGMNADGELMFDLIHVTWAPESPRSNAGND
jgi:hypothetical protein